MDNQDLQNKDYTYLLITFTCIYKNMNFCYN